MEILLMEMEGLFLVLTNKKQGVKNEKQKQQKQYQKQQKTYSQTYQHIHSFNNYGKYINQHIMQRYTRKFSTIKKYNHRRQIKHGKRNNQSRTTGRK